jgi:ABC-2 type transport system ATP-binding protein
MSLSSPLAVSTVSKHFGKHHVLDNVSLEMKTGEIFGLIGLNGEGKTTLIKIILDLLSADSGNVSFFGEASTIPKSRRHIAFLPEKFAPSALLKGHEFLKLAMEYSNRSYDTALGENYAQLLGLNPLALKQRVNKYSKGMGQKLGLLSVFLSKAPLLILDEPMSGLDPRARIQLKDLMLGYKEEGKSIFFSSHILADIEEICDRIAVLHHRKILFVGTPKDFITSQQGKGLERSFLHAIDAVAA